MVDLYEYDEKAAARMLGVAARTLRRWRIAGKVAYHRTPGGRVRYSVDQLIALQRATRVEATSGALPTAKAA